MTSRNFILPFLLEEIHRILQFYFPRDSPTRRIFLLQEAFDSIQSFNNTHICILQDFSRHSKHSTGFHPNPAFFKQNAYSTILQGSPNWLVSKNSTKYQLTHSTFQLLQRKGDVAILVRMTLLAEIELIHFSILSSRDHNCHNDIQLFLQQFEKFCVYCVAN